MDLDDKRINELDRKADSSRNKSKRKREERSAIAGIFDKQTLETVNRLYVKGVIDQFVGLISSGKESNVYFVYGENNQPLIIKIYKIDPQNTKWMKNYIIGDPRFHKIGTTTTKIIHTWCKKEFKNLTQLYRSHIPVPKPVISLDNILVMEFIGDENGTPAPRLKDVAELENPKELMNKILENISKMYLNAHLVHGDLSEFNILMYQDQPIIIDVSQAVSVFHVNAAIYLERDIKNILSFFKNYIDEKDLPDCLTLTHEIIGKGNF